MTNQGEAVVNVVRRALGSLTPVRLIGLGLLAGAALVTLALYGSDWKLVREHLLDNLITMMLGIGIGALVFDAFSTANRKRVVLAQIGSPVRDVAHEGVRLARTEGWLGDGLLRGARLIGANLQGAALPGANLQGVVLSQSNLQGATLSGADIHHADLDGCDLQGAALARANLQGATVRLANLQGAVLEGANLQGADFSVANLRGANLNAADLRAANLKNAEFDEETRLPNGTLWTADTAMGRFTDTNHPEFWRPPH